MITAIVSSVPKQMVGFRTLKHGYSGNGILQDTLLSEHLAPNKGCIYVKCTHLYSDTTSFRSFRKLPSLLRRGHTP